MLCNACGSRWRTKGTLDNYLPKHAYTEKQSGQLPSEMKPHLLAHDDQMLEVGVEVSGQKGSSACLDEEMNNISSLVLAGSSSDNYMQMEETNGKVISLIYRALNLSHQICCTIRIKSFLSVRAIKSGTPI